MKENKKQTAKEIIINTINNSTSIKDLHGMVKAAGTECHIDTVRNAVKELVAEGKLVKTENADGTTYKKFQPVKEQKERLIIDKTTRGWKMMTLKSMIISGMETDRRALAIMIKSDERNTHIMVSKINEKIGNRIGYNKANHSYFLNAN